MKNCNDFVSKEFLMKYDFLVYCRNVLVDILKYADDNDLSKTKIDFKNDEDFIKFVKLESNEEIFDYLYSSNHKEKLLRCCEKNLFFLLIRDFYNYYSVSLENIARKNVSVSWCVLRRPLQETLALIEWLYVNADEFLMLLLESKEVNEYDISKHKCSGGKIEKNIKSIMSKTFNNYTNIDMHKFRYSKTEINSLNGILNGANHLVVSKNKSFMTSPSGLNFIFLNGNEFKEGLNAYYEQIPFVLYYTMTIILKMFEEFSVVSDYTKMINEYIFLLNAYTKVCGYSVERAIDEINVDVSIMCVNCGKHIEKDYFIKCFYENQIQCPFCRRLINFDTYIFNYESSRLDNENDK